MLLLIQSGKNSHFIFPTPFVALKCHHKVTIFDAFTASAAIFSHHFKWTKNSNAEKRLLFFVSTKLHVKGTNTHFGCSCGVF